MLDRFIDSNGNFDQEAWDRHAQAKRDELALADHLNHELIVKPRLARAGADGDFARSCVWESHSRRCWLNEKKGVHHDADAD